MKIEKLNFNTNRNDCFDFFVVTKINELIDAFNSLEKNDELLLIPNSEYLIKNGKLYTIHQLLAEEEHAPHKTEIKPEIDFSTLSDRLERSLSKKEEKEPIRSSLGQFFYDLKKKEKESETLECDFTGCEQCKKEQDNEILGCPWCSSRGIIAFFEEPRQPELYHVLCPNMNCKVNPITNYFETKEEATNAWNLRAK
jgi:hypothetical protein